MIKLTLGYSLACLLALAAAGQSVPNLINYQGRLTDATGASLPAASYGIQFRLWDSPTATNGLIWGQQQNVSVQANGIFNVLLGAPGGTSLAGITDLSLAFADSSRYLGVTLVSSNGINTSFPGEILPRQQLLSVPFAMLALHVANSAITSNQIAAQTISTPQIASNSIALDRLALRPVGTNVPPGGIVRSESCGSFISPTPQTFTTIDNFSLTIRTRGNPVEIFFVDDGDTNCVAYFTTVSSPPLIQLRLLRDGVPIGTQDAFINAGSNLDAPPGAFRFFDDVQAGTYNYQAQIANPVASSSIKVSRMRMIVREL